MRLKKLGAALFVVAALGVVMASSAFAAATTTDVQWYTGASPGTLLTTSPAVSSSIVGTEATFTTTVSGTTYKLKSTGINCIGCTISNSGSTAVGSGELEFTGVSVVEPAGQGCTVTSTVKTNPLSITADWMIGSVNYVKFVPTAGEAKAFATVEITGCSAATSIVPKGSVFVETENPTGTQATPQTVSSSAAINSTAGGSLHVGTETASLTGTASFTIAGGAAFGTH